MEGESRQVWHAQTAGEANYPLSYGLPHFLCDRKGLFSLRSICKRLFRCKWFLCWAAKTFCFSTLLFPMSNESLHKLLVLLSGLGFHVLQSSVVVVVIVVVFLNSRKIGDPSSLMAPYSHHVLWPPPKKGYNQKWDDPAESDPQSDWIGPPPKSDNLDLYFCIFLLLLYILYFTIRFSLIGAPSKPDILAFHFCNCILYFAIRFRLNLTFTQARCPSVLISDSRFRKEM